MIPKIALFIPNLEGGGAERATVVLANQLIKQGYSVDIILVRKSGPFVKKISKEVKLVVLSDKIFFYCKPVYALSAFYGLYKYIKRNKPSHLISSLTGANITTLLIKKIFNINTKVIIVEHNTLLNINSKGKTYYYFMKWLYPTSDKIITVSKGIFDDIHKKLGITDDKICVINNPHDIDKIREMGKSCINHEWFFDKNIPIILGIGRLCPQKDFSTLIKAAAIVRKKMRIRVIILGEGDELHNLKTLCNKLNIIDDVYFAGFVENPFAYLKQSSLYVLSSRWEGLPNSIIESLIVGTPVVATDCHSGPSEILQNGKYGKLVPVNDPTSLANAILEQIETFPDRKNLMKRAEIYSPENISRNYIELLESL